MKAVVCRQYGLAHAQLETLDSRPLTAGEVRIAVKASGVSFANLLVIEGKHQNRADPPFTPGTEVAGVVLECAPDVQHFQPGDRVVAGVRHGGHAEEVIAPVGTVFALPDAVDFAAASHFPTLYATAYAAAAPPAAPAAATAAAADDDHHHHHHHHHDDDDDDDDG